MSEDKTACERCGKELPTGIYVQHLYRAHGIDVWKIMQSRARTKGLAWTGMVLLIGVLLGILLRGMI